jgi:hypothetical protein
LPLDGSQALENWDTVRDMLIKQAAEEVQPESDSDEDKQLKRI